ncbi:hypothetical protein B0T19DRAFT_482417 [Cercophora scortea]|uniref:Uncharacterized protein n=1 Tax=Cercophora scortea TaxID=314031 RepID=A0AAE0MH62_9PEZI|nr:hypothetical protein B0T19DRAFT_482417 [Cercophora scortea]
MEGDLVAGPVENRTATVAGRNTNYAIVSSEFQAADAGNQDPPLQQPQIFLQPEIRPFSEEQLVAEVKGIYGGLVIIENKCKELQNPQVQIPSELTGEQWKALVELHRRLLWALGDDDDRVLGRRWKAIAEEEYTRVLDYNPGNGRLYHHLAVLNQPSSLTQTDADFEVLMSHIFYFTKSLVVQEPYTKTRESIRVVMKRIINKNKQEAPLTDKDHFLTAVAHLILANDLGASKEDHHQVVYRALNFYRWNCRPPRACPHPQHSSQLLLGISTPEGGRSVMMEAWAGKFVRPAARADLAAKMADVRDISEATIKMIHTMVCYVLEGTDTCDLGLWGFIYVLLVFMRSLKTRPDLLDWFGWAFHAELLAPFLDMLLRQDETRGGDAWESAARGEFPTTRSPLNRKEKAGKYGIRTRDRMAEGSERTTKASDATQERDQDTNTPDAERMFTSPLPEHELLRGHIFAREPNSTWYKYLAGERQSKEVQGELLRDPPLFPAGWFKNSKYDFDQRQVRQKTVQDAETWVDRSRQMLWLTFQLRDAFFSLRTDEDGRHFISVPDAEPVSQPKLDINLKMPEVVERDGGVRVVYVDRSIRMAEEELGARGEQNDEAAIDRAACVEKAEGDTKEARAQCVGGGWQDTAESDGFSTTAQVDDQAAAGPRPPPGTVAGAAQCMDMDMDVDMDMDDWTHMSDESCYGDK